MLKVRKEIFIQEVKKHACIWNIGSSEYINKNKRDQAWAKVSEATGLTPYDCRRKWKVQRDRFVREVRYLERKRTNTTSDKEPTSKWPLYHQMEFLKGTVSSRRKGNQDIAHATTKDDEESPSDNNEHEISETHPCNFQDNVFYFPEDEGDKTEVPEPSRDSQFLLETSHNIVEESQVLPHHRSEEEEEEKRSSSVEKLKVRNNHNFLMYLNDKLNELSKDKRETAELLILELVTDIKNE